MRKFYTIIKGNLNQPVKHSFLKWVRKNLDLFGEEIKINNTHSPFNKIIKKGYIMKEWNGDVYAVQPDENKSIQYSESIFTSSKGQIYESPKTKLKEAKTPSQITTIHSFIDLYLITKESTKLILGTIHPHQIELFQIDFFYGNVGSLWRILTEAFPQLKFENREQIIQILKKYNIAITDIISQCDRENINITRDSELFNIVLNRDLILNGLKSSKIDTIYFTSGFGKNNAAKLFLQTFKIKIDFNFLTREFIIPAQYFGREIKCIVLYSPSGEANRGISNSKLYLNRKAEFLKFQHPVAEFKKRFYQEKFSFLRNPQNCQSYE